MRQDYLQGNLFVEDKEETSKEKIEVSFDGNTIDKFKSYSLDKYITDVEVHGLAYTWAYICKYVLSYGENSGFINIKNFGEMYEIGLALQDKIQKKNNGQYYTPEDVALIMSKWLEDLDGKNICDVACGTGKLILTFLDFVGTNKAKKLIQDGKLYLYDLDEVALNICKTAILMKYGKNLNDKIHCFAADFLSAKIKLPENYKVISNPPYAAIQQPGFDWQTTQVLNDSRELYSFFMEKIIKTCTSAVIITPYSFTLLSKKTSRPTQKAAALCLRSIYCAQGATRKSNRKCRGAKKLTMQFLP